MRLIIRISTQTAELWDDGDVLMRTYRISTSKYGLGTEVGSYKTPLGRFAIAEKIGEGAPLGARFRARVCTGEVWSTEHPACEEDMVLTRILWLAGLDEGNANTKERYIYLHGTNDEAGIGEAKSHGCVRFANVDVVDLFDRVEVGTQVEIMA